MSELGEIVDYDEDDFEVYVPVERPQGSAGGGWGRPAPLSDSESSLDGIPPPLPSKVAPPQKKKYNIWCSDPDVLSESLLDIGVAPGMKERSVESYNYRLKFARTTHSDESSDDDPPFDMDTEKEEARRRRKGMALRNRKNSKSLLLVPKTLDNLCTTVDSSVEDVAKDITVCLQETNEDLVHLIVKVLGPAKAIDLYRKTKEIEREGGMLILDQSRRRTSGGIFFFLVRGDHEISSEQLRDIFDSSKSMPSTKVRRRRKKRTKPTSKANSLEEIHRVGSDNLYGIGCDDERRLSQSPERPPLDNPPPSPATDVEPSQVKSALGSDATEDDQMDM